MKTIISALGETGDRLRNRRYVRRVFGDCVACPRFSSAAESSRMLGRHVKQEGARWDRRFRLSA
jgi:hypothetical protein